VTHSDDDQGAYDDDALDKDETTPLKQSQGASAVSGPAEASDLEIESPELGTAAPIASRWHRINSHPAFGPVLTLTGLVAGLGLTILMSRSPQASKQIVAAVREAVPDRCPKNLLANANQITRTPPIEHMVSGHKRLQHYGPGGSQTKLVKVQSYSRGGRC